MTVKLITCPDCEGYKQIKVSCPHCTIETEEECKECGGQGDIIEECPTCLGYGMVEDDLDGISVMSQKVKAKWAEWE